MSPDPVHRASFSADLARSLGMTAIPIQAARRPLRWRGPAHSMDALVPDAELRGTNRVIWIAAKYKAHLDLLTCRGWTAQSQDLQNAHRADLHQALAYASLADAPQVDTLLLYPQLATHTLSPATVATVTSGRRRVRLVLAAVPLGYRNPGQKEQCLRSFRDLLAAWRLYTHRILALPANWVSTTHKTPVIASRIAAVAISPRNRMAKADVPQLANWATYSPMTASSDSASSSSTIG